MEIWYYVINQPCVSNETYLSDNLLYSTLMSQLYSIFIHNNTLINLINIFTEYLILYLLFTYYYVTNYCLKGSILEM